MDPGYKNDADHTDPDPDATLQVKIWRRAL